MRNKCKGEEKYLKNTFLKTTTLIALFLIFAIAASPFTLPISNAQGSKNTYAFIGALPNPVGVGQEVLLHVGISHELAEAAYGWEGLTVTVTKPDGHTETLGPFKTDSTGGTGTIFVPTMAGNYTLQTHYPEQEMPITSSGVPAGTVMQASDSDKLTLVVTEEPREYYPGAPLPTEYWTRPIDDQLREWYTVAGNWPVPSALFGPSIHPAWVAPYNDGPETAHILWTKPFEDGGLVGGELGLVGSGGTSVGFGIGDAYEGKWSGSMIIAGRLYYQAGGSRGLLPVVYHCVDLHTGEELWAKTFLNNQTIAFGQLLYFQSFNYQGTFAYLWVTVGGGRTGLPESWYAFDALNGDWRFTVTNVPSGTTLRDERGGLYRLNVDQVNGRMTLWNMTALGTWSGTGYSAGGSWGNNVHMQTLDAAADTTAAHRAWEWNVTIPTDLPGGVRAAWLGDRVVGSQNSLTEIAMWGLSLEQGREGTLLFRNTWNAPSEWVAGNLTFPGMSGGWVAYSSEDKVAVLGLKETREWYGFSLETGDRLWGPTEPIVYLDQYFGDGRWIAYGRFYSVGVGGIAYCYNVTTGELLWTYEAADPYTEFLFSSNWWLEPMFVTDGKIYLGHAEHSANQPLPRGAPFICLNATTGEVIWRADGLFRQTHWGGLAIIGDSIIATQDTYDQRVYAIGKGPSATTVGAAPKVLVYGDSTLVEGMVTDISPGTEKYGLTARFPDGVPAVSDANMSDWMLYVYKQFARPDDVIGVEVVVSVLDPNNNVYEVGRTTSDASGFYSCEFTPEVPGKYTVIASFEGSEAYYGSFAETAVSVKEAPTATPEPTPTPASASELYLVPGIVGIIVAIAVVGAILMLMLRKR
jgi:hypothetical protein